MESGNGTVRGGSGLSWDIWAVGNWGETTTTTTTAAAAPTTATGPSPYHHYHHADQQAAQTMTSFSTSTFSPLQHHYSGSGSGGAESHHHLTCLKLGKRQYYEGGLHVAPELVLPSGGGGMGVKKEKVVGSSSSSSPPPPPSSAAAVVPRCQVEGCNVALVDAKDYHKRHKVCEAHSKSPKVVVLGLEQRFCQQCSRFHVISEFDDSKRSCRRRLAGHNERRRKSSNESIIRNPSLDNTLMGGRFPYIPSSTCPGRALSLLSAEASPWVPSDLSYRSSAALHELIAENRAALLARQLLLDRGCYSSGQETNAAAYSEMPHHHSVPYGIPSQFSEGWHHFHEANPHVTLDLMQVPSSSFEILSGRNKPREEDEEECCEIWKTLEETHVV